MDQITRSLLREFAVERDLLGLPEHKQFEHFCTYAILRRMFSGTFDTIEVIVGDEHDRGADGVDLRALGGDTGIDGVGIMINGRLITDPDELEELDQASYWEVTFAFVQTDTASSFDTTKLSRLGDGVIDFFADPPLFVRNQGLQRFCSVRRSIYDNSPKFTKGNPSCKIYYVTTGKLKVDDLHMQAQISKIRGRLEESGLLGAIEIEPLGAGEIQALYHRTKRSASATFNFPNRVTITKIQSVEQAYSGFLPWSEYKKIVTTEDNRLDDSLFFDNIRDWQGYNDVNTEIKNSLNSEEKKQFVLMNNGVTIIARELRPTGDSFHIEDYQIVNGCQTTHVLFDQRNEIDDSVAVPVKVINTKDEGIINAITKATNRQTRVKPEQLFALQEYPKALETYFASFETSKRLYFERRDRQYDSGRERQGVIQQVRVISFADMIRAFASMFLNEPHRTTRNFKGVKAKIGKDIFVKDQRMELYYTAAFALYKTRFCIRSNRIGREFSPATFHILLVLRILIAGFERPNLRAKNASVYCKKIWEILHDQARCEEYVIKAARLVEEAGGGLDRDDVRTEPYTERVIAKAKECFGRL